jgi:uncharacterized protein YcfJ
MRPIYTAIRSSGVRPLIVVSLFCASAAMAQAQLEEVRILRAEPIQVQVCGTAPQAAAQPQAGGGLTGTQVLGTAAGAAIGGLLGNQVGRGSGRTLATVGGAAVGGAAGYALTPDGKPAPQAQAQSNCSMQTQYRVYFARQNGAQGDLLTPQAPSGQAMMINFCGDKPCQ